MKREEVIERLVALVESIDESQVGASPMKAAISAVGIALSTGTEISFCRAVEDFVDSIRVLIGLTEILQGGSPEAN